MALSTSSHTGTEVTAEPNVVPMIDVMLVLLVIFMIVTPLITAGFQATMPHGLNPGAHPEEEDEILLGIDRNGSFYLQKLPISEEELPIALERLYITRTKDKILFLRADESVNFGRVQDAIEIARQAGVRVVGAVTDKREDIFGEQRRRGE